MFQSKRQRIRFVRGIIAGFPLMGALLLAGTVSNAYAFHITMTPLAQADSLVARDMTMHQQHEVGAVLTTFQLPEHQQAARGGQPPDGEKMTKRETREKTDHNTIEFKGTTTSRVGADNLLHFKVGDISWKLPLTANTDLRDIGGSPQAIKAQQRVEVEVKVIGTRMIVIKVEPGD